MTITSSPHLVPDDVVRHTFASVRRGFDPAEVRDYLESIADGLRGLAERERELRAGAGRGRGSGGKPGARRTDPDRGAREGDRPGPAQRARGRRRDAGQRRGRGAAPGRRSDRDRRGGPGPGRDARCRAVGRDRGGTRALRERTDAAGGRGAGQGARRSRADDRAGPSRSAGPWSRRPSSCGPGCWPTSPVAARCCTPRSSSCVPGASGSHETIHDVRRSVDGIADDLFNAENEARLAAEVAGREAAAAPRREHPRSSRPCWWPRRPRRRCLPRGGARRGRSAAARRVRRAGRAGRRAVRQDPRTCAARAAHKADETPVPEREVREAEARSGPEPGRTGATSRSGTRAGHAAVDETPAGGTPVVEAEGPPDGAASDGGAPRRR